MMTTRLRRRRINRGTTTTSATRGGARGAARPGARGARVAATRAAAAVDADRPVPKVIIDNKSDAFATVLEVSFGEYLGELLDTVAALKNLGLDISRGEVSMEGKNKTSKFYVVDRATSEKVTASARLEEIRQTILTNMVQFHPEAAEYIQSKKPKRRGEEAPLGKVATTVKTNISCEPERYHTKLTVECTDRPGLLVDIVRTLKDLSLNVVSAEVDTIGDKAHDVIYVTHQGSSLSKNMEQLVVNSLSYYLSLSEEESY